MNKKELSERDICTKFITPALVTGGFPTCALEHIRKREVKSPADEQRLHDSIRGVEKKPLPHLLCVTNMLLHGIEVPVNVRQELLEKCNLHTIVRLPNGVFGPYTATAGDMRAVRNAIISLGVQGYLTAAWRGTAAIDESAQQFVSGVARARAKAWGERRARANGAKCPEPFAHEALKLPTIPNSWVWASADAVCSQITDGEHIQPPYQTAGLPMLSAKHVRDGFVTMEKAPLVSKADFQKAIDRCEPKNGDILIVSVGGTTGRSAIVTNCPPFSIVRSVLLLKPLVSAEFFLRWVQTPWCFRWMTKASGASAQPHLYIRDIKRMPVPVPPLVEQQRIVAKVDELLRWCDALEAGLTATQTTATHFLDATLHQILKPAA
jgi:type I restriction enzyme, S subunit